MRPGVRLAFDVGTSRIGVARCDQEGILAVPALTLRRDRYGSDLDEAADLVGEYAAVEVLVGLPRSMAGGSSSSAQDSRRWARSLAGTVAPVPVRLVDERLTTVTAHRRLHEAGLRERTFRGVVDEAAAVVILEQALETERLTGQPPGERVPPSKRGSA
ncbi:Holliday junction resolvase RuvX [Actinomyces sp. 2119]|uniref:Putative pre-16S rRNA nuclease n=1 Tax=Actinomyces lilanjuaniae TaxID=2321394 RepID=A0ABN5PU33_9ACTO|nr:MULTISPECIES: Holliday junction resolvase RuvX [Actinomyces]AYD90844.1 Holliday junction resolvase RuvX [Actinomyces lilanjuaniae]RJF44946.1 Holliday junction resolvase RuvX [Actinomyces sp. 2119]